MAKKVSVTNLEQEALGYVFQKAVENGLEGKYRAALEGLRRKLAEPERRREGLSLPDAEMALGGCRKYAPFRGGNRWVMEGRMRNLAVKQGELEAVGEWADSQGWITEITLVAILRNWTDWLARAARWYQQRGVHMPVWQVSSE